MSGLREGFLMLHDETVYELSQKYALLKETNGHFTRKQGNLKTKKYIKQQ